MQHSNLVKSSGTLHFYSVPLSRYFNTQDLQYYTVALEDDQASTVR